MKKTITTLVMTIASAFAQEPLPTKIDVTILPSEERLPKHSFSYMRAEVAPISRAGVIPGVGVGYRLASKEDAIDISSSYGIADHNKRNGAYFTFPKVNYLHYLTPSLDSSPYFGGGIAFGGITTDAYVDERLCGSNHEFVGMLASAAVGYEMHRQERVRTFVQLDVNQPAVSMYTRGSFPGPWASVGIGAGF